VPKRERKKKKKDEKKGMEKMTEDIKRLMGRYVQYNFLCIYFE